MEKETIGATVGGITGVAGSVGAVSSAGAIAGLSGPGIVSGLFSLGLGSMVGGLVVVAAIPLTGAAVGYGAVKLLGGNNER